MALGDRCYCNSHRDRGRRSRRLDDTVADCVHAAIIPAEQADALTLAAWGLGHGLASLRLNGKLTDSHDDPGALTAKITGFLHWALTPRRPTTAKSGKHPRRPVIARWPRCTAHPRRSARFGCAESEASRQRITGSSARSASAVQAPRVRP